MFTYQLDKFTIHIIHKIYLPTYKTFYSILYKIMAFLFLLQMKFFLIEDKRNGLETKQIKTGVNPHKKNNSAASIVIMQPCFFCLSLKIP